MSKELSKEKVIDKILKMFAQKNPKFKEEADSALLLAQKWMIEYDVTQEDLEKAENKEIISGAKNSEEKLIKPFTNYMKTFPVYDGRLAMIIADNFRCYCWISNDAKFGKRLMMIGLKNDVKLAFEVYHFALNSMNYHMKQFIKEEYTEYGLTASQGVKNDYMSGYVKGLDDKFNKQVKENNFAIALVKHEIVLDAWAELKKELGIKSGRVRHTSSANDRDARSEGYKQGKQFEYGLGSLK
jgi:hypothetical protein